MCCIIMKQIVLKYLYTNNYKSYNLKSLLLQNFQVKKLYNLTDDFTVGLIKITSSQFVSGYSRF